MSSKFLSKRHQTLYPYVYGEQPHDRVYIKLNANENPYPPSPLAIKAAEEEAARMHHYCDPSCGKLIHTLAAFYGVGDDQVFVGCGLDEVLSFAFTAFLDETTEVRLPDLTYEFYQGYFDSFHIPYRLIPVRSDLTVDPADYPPGGPVVLANPNAPSGKALSLAQIRQLLDDHRDQFVLIDEAYVDYGAESCLPLIREYDNLLVAQTFSKSRNMAGARLGFGFGQPQLIADVLDIKACFNPFNVDGIAQAAGIAAVNDKEYFYACNRRIIATREKFAADLRALGLEVVDSLTNFMLARYPGVNGADLQAAWKRHGVLVRHYRNPRIADWVRISIGTQAEMDKVVALVPEILGELGVH